MSRRQKTITITAEGRDKGKIFVICEMTARDAEDWAMRALEAIAQRSEIPAGLINAGMLGVFILGLKPVLAAPYAMMKPLMDEMFAKCLSIQPEIATPATLRGAGTPLVPPLGKMIDEDMEEVATRVILRDAIFELHTGFSPAAVLSRMWGEIVTVAVSLTTPTSPAPSEPSSREAQA